MSSLRTIRSKSSRTEIVLKLCPAMPDCVAANIAVPASGTTCPQCGAPVFPTGALRIHEEVAEEHPNLTALGRLMTVVEHLTLVAYVGYLQQRQPRVLGTVGFILDGPLALFGPQAWLHTAILNFLRSGADDLIRAGLNVPVVIGIEKGGQFAEHADAIADRIPPRTVMTLPDDYIYKYILTFRPSTTGGYRRLAFAGVARGVDDSAPRLCENPRMAVEGFDFSCTVALPDGTAATVHQTDVVRGTRQDMTFFVRVTPVGRRPFAGALHLAGSSLTNLDACPGETRADRSLVVTSALLAWVLEHGLEPDFTLDVMIGEDDGDPCHVAISVPCRRDG